MLENSMVLPSVAPIPTFDHLQPEREASCVVCKATACLLPDGWYPDCRIEDDNCFPCLEGIGIEFIDAADTPHGWVCSKLCRSQIMYEHASDADKKDLRKVMEACRVIEEYGHNALSLIETGMGESLTEKLNEGAYEFLTAVYGVDDMPKWCE